MWNDTVQVQVQAITFFRYGGLPSDRLVESSLLEHIRHVPNIADIPSSDILIESSMILEELVHVRHPGHVPAGKVEK